MYLLETNKLTKKYSGRAVVNAVDMHIEQGDIYGFIGKNGAGKTTLMRMVLNLAFPNEGEIRVFGSTNLSEAGKKIGSLVENPGFYHNCTARENLLRFSTLYGADAKKVDEILQFVGLADTGKKKAKQFSLGMKQRLGIAIAMLGEPELMILDEPVNGLDPAGMKEIRDLIVRLNQERGVTFLISSHLLEELSKMVTKYGIINDGSLIEEISAEELERRCSHKLKIVVDDAEQARTVLEKWYPDVEMEIEGETIFLGNHLEDSARMNQELVAAGIMVSELCVQNGNLEEYFMQRIGG